MAVELLAVPALLMSMTEIAELAKVQRPVVTTWRRRHRDFPAPVGGDAAQPLFDPRQVADWLISTGRADRDQIEPELSLYTLTGLADQYPGTDLVAAVTALICLRYLTDENEPLADGTDETSPYFVNRRQRSTRTICCSAQRSTPSRLRRSGWPRSSTSSSRRPGAAVRRSSGSWRPGTGSG